MRRLLPGVFGLALLCCGVAVAQEKDPIQKAKSTERARVRDALEHLGPYEGLVRTCPPAFSPSRHEALSPSDYRMATFNPRGVLVLVQP